MKRAQLVFWPLFIGSAITVLARGGEMSYTLFYICCGLFTFGMTFAIGVSANTTLRPVMLRGYVVAGQPLKWRVEIMTRFFLPVPAMNVEIEVSADAKKKGLSMVPVTPFKTAVIDLEHTFPYRGTYELGIRRWRAPDYFAIFWAGSSRGATRTVCVLPRVLRINAPAEPLPDLETSSFSPLAVPEQDGTRPYENTDTIRNIHWKLSAKTEDSFMVRKTRGSVPRPVCVVVDITKLPVLAESRPCCEDKLLETAFSLIRHLMDMTEVRVIMVGAECRTHRVRVRADFAELYSLYGPVEFEDGNFAEQLYGLDMDDKAVLWVVSGHHGRGVLDLLAGQATCEYPPGEANWLYVAADKFFCLPDERSELEAAEALGVKTRAITDGSDFRDCEDMLL
ncbi:hypothetical protein FACS1894217_12940 [Clostridia bacterium]|nr:hypothetical protein FACS1894217_12940 [Clostridia bacterium]